MLSTGTRGAARLDQFQIEQQSKYDERRCRMATDFKLGSFPEVSFSYEYVPVDAETIHFTISATGTIRRCRSLQASFKTWCKEKRCKFSTSETRDVNGMSTNTISVTVDFKSLLELLLYDVDLYRSYGCPLS